jgi:hypothetical protein
MTSFWKVGIRTQSERKIQLDYRIFQCRNETLKSYVNKDGSLVSVESKILLCPATIINTRLVEVTISYYIP